MRGQPEIAKYLIARGLDVNANSGISESNAADFAASEGDLEMLQYVHEQGAIFDTSEPTKNPLFSAIVGGHVDVVRYLLEHGIDYSVRYNSETMTEMDALQFAEERGETECATIIRSIPKHKRADNQCDAPRAAKSRCLRLLIARRRRVMAAVTPHVVKADSSATRLP
jgi:ankyrin repeat protein